MLEIVISESEKNVLTYSNLFKKNDIVSFSLLLTYGKIKDIEQSEYKRVLDVELNPKCIFNELIEKINDYDGIRIWYSSCDSEGINTYYFLVNYFGNKNKTIYCCDVYNKEYFSLGSYDSTKIEKLLLNTKKLNNDEINNICLIWQKLLEENGDLRLLENNRLVSCSFDFLDNVILEYLSLYDNSIKYHSFIGTLVSKELFGIRGDLFFSARIDYLNNTGKIIVERIVREKNIIGEIVIKKYIMINKM